MVYNCGRVASLQGISEAVSDGGEASIAVLLNSLFRERRKGRNISYDSKQNTECFDSER